MRDVSWKGTWLGAVVCALGASAGCAHDAERKTGPVVEDFVIEGARQVEAGDIKDRLLTAETSWLPFAPKQRLDPGIWRQDLKRIERYYRARGYYQAQVVSSDIRPAGEDAVTLRVQVEEGEPTRVSRVQLEGLSALTAGERRALEREVGLSEGDVFLEAPWETLPERLTGRLNGWGYAEATVDADAEVDLARQTAALAVRVTPGLRYRIGAVTVRQAEGARVEPWRIEEQAREVLEIYPYLSSEARHALQERIFGMGVFGAAQVVQGRGDPRTGELPIAIEVAEAPFHEVAWGFGFGFEQRRQEAHLVGEYTHRDFLGGLRRLDLRATAGWAFIPNIYTATAGGDAVTESGPIARLTAELSQPRLLHPNVQLDSLLEVERAIEPAYAFTGGRARVGIPWRPRTWVTVEPSYNLEVYRLTSGATSLTGEAPELLFGCDRTCVLSYLEERFIYDRRDDPQAPKEGFYLALALQQGGGPLGGSFDYLRVVPEARAYQSFGAARRLTLATRLRVGTLIPLGGAEDLDTPVVARFFSGGDPMRGFSAQRLSPMRLAEKTEPTGEYDAEPVPIGGNGLFEASVEARYDLTGSLTLAAFVDAGFVTTEHAPLRPAWISDNLLWAVGTGLRYRTPVGPVRLDLAYRLPFGPPLRVYDEGRGLTYLPSEGCFGIGRTSSGRGGAPEGVCALHLSIGEAF